MYAVLYFLKSHWQGCLAAVLLLRIGWSLKNNEDLQEHQKYLRFGLLAVVAAFVLGALLGSSSGHPLAGWLGGAFLVLFPLYFLSRVADRAFNDMLGGLFFDLIFSEGVFAPHFIPLRKLPNVTLLRHWREHGQVTKAYRKARWNLRREERAYPLWLFAAETAALHRNDLAGAERFIRRLHRCQAFTADQRAFAVLELKGWAATRGVNLEVKRFASRRPQARRNPIKEAAQLREAGFYQEARTKLELLLHREPDNLAAGLMLMRIFAQDLQQPAKAEKLLKEFAAQRFTSEAYVEFAQRSIAQWQAVPPALSARKRSWWARVTHRDAEPQTSSTRIKLQGLVMTESPVHLNVASTTGGLTIGDLLREGRIETALTEVERRIAAQPDEFDSWNDLLKILTQHAVNLKRARAVLDQVEQHPAFTAEQKKLAKELLRQGEAARVQRAIY